MATTKNTAHIRRKNSHCVYMNSLGLKHISKEAYDQHNSIGV